MVMELLLVVLRRRLAMVMLTVVGGGGRDGLVLVVRRPLRPLVPSLFHHFALLVAQQLLEVVVELLKVLDGERLVGGGLRGRRHRGGASGRQEKAAPHFALFHRSRSLI